MEDRACVSAMGSGPGCRRAPGAGRSAPARSRSPTCWRAACWPRGSCCCTARSTTCRSTRVSAELMTLDAEGDEPVTLRVDCGEAALAPALTLMDVIELMGVPVRALCLGQVGVGRRRRGGRLRPPRRPAQHPLLPARARDPPRRPTCATWPSGPSCGPPSGSASAPGWAPPAAARPPRSRRIWSTDVSSVRPRRSSTASSTRCAGPTPPWPACPGSGPPPMGFRPLR